MKKRNLLLLITVTILSISSCKKKEEDEGKLPNISFKTGTGYTSADATVTKGSTVTIGINSSKSEENDVLITFDESVSYDGTAATSILNKSLTGSDGDSYSIDLPTTTRNQAGTEKYTFTVINRDGLKNSVSLTLTTN